MLYNISFKNKMPFLIILDVTVFPEASNPPQHDLLDDALWDVDAVHGDQPTELR